MRTATIVLALFVVLAAGWDASAPAPHASAGRFDGNAAFESVRRQVALGPRPAGSRASRVLAERLRRTLPGGRFQAVPGGLRNVVGSVRGRDPKRFVVVGAHYDTKDIAGFVGANDGASGTAVVTQLAHGIKPRRLRSTVVFVLFDGEESPPNAPVNEFARYGLRGSKVAARRYSKAEAMILLDFVGQRNLRIPRELNSDPGVWRQLRAAAKRVGAGSAFPPGTAAGILDDHTPFTRRGVASIDLIDFDYDCFHKVCDDLSQVSPRSLDATGETVRELLRTL